MTLSKLACGMPFNKVLNILGHFRPVVMFLEHGTSLLNTKMIDRSPTMKLLDQKLPKPASLYAKSVTFKQKGIINVKLLVEDLEHYS